MAHATVLASFNVEQFGTERIVILAGDEIAARASRELLERLSRASAGTGTDATGRA